MAKVWALKGPRPRPARDGGPLARAITPVVTVFAALVVGLWADGGAAEVARIEVLSRSVLAGGRAFGAVGAYEKITGRLHYAVDPDNSANARIVDLRLAPRDAAGRVRFSGDFILIKPVDPGRGNGRLLYGVNNRGNLILLNVFNDAPWNNAPESAADLGNGFLLERGYTLLWSAWNWDVLAGGGRLQIDLPVAAGDGKTITGAVAAEITVDHGADVRPVAWGGSRGYAPADPDEPGARLTVRAAPEDKRRDIPRHRWRFVDAGGAPSAPVSIALEGGFRPGMLYELVYTAKAPRVVGLGLAAIRDALSFFRYAAADKAGTPNPLAVDRGKGPEPAPTAVIVYGFSQSARVIQHMVMEALHVDEAGRSAFDAALIHGAGAGKGAFNHRFAQTTRHPSQAEDHLYPADVFPFTTTAQRDPVTGAAGSVLERARKAGAIPFLFYLSSATEYWTRAASLLHTDVTGRRDIALDPRARLYVIAGAQHTAAGAGRGIFENCANPLDYRPLARALLVALDGWATAGREPPASRYPRLDDGTLGPVSAYRRRFPALPGLRLPTGNLRPPRLDLRPRFAARGIQDRVPARRGRPFVTLVPLPDRDGQDLGGIALPAVAVPLGTYLGWNLRRKDFGAPARLGRWQGSFVAFAATEAERRSSGDPRASIAARHGSRARFVESTRAAATALERRRLLLPEDLAAIEARAGRTYDAVTAAPPGSRACP
ncbi:MAG: alpha/beta hydrolase domain-containing protein [Alphaproteobacteria bacterium]